MTIQLSKNNSSARREFPSIMDIEASGFGNQSYPIEIGVVASSGARYCSLIRPEPEWTHWCKDAASIHCIPRRSLLLRGAPIREVASELNEFLKDSTVYSDGWSHDKTWLIKLFYAANMPPTFRLSPIEAITSDEQLAIWDDTKQIVAANMGLLRHRASSDALMIQQTYLETRRKLRDYQMLGNRRLEELKLRHADKPLLGYGSVAK